MTWRPRGFRLGKMRERIRIQETREYVDDYGDRVEGPKDILVAEPASYLAVRGGETVRGRTIDSSIDAIFEIHYNATIVPKMQVVFDGMTYGIVDVRPAEGGKRYLELFCKSVVPDVKCT